MSVGIDKLASELQKVIEEKDKNKKTPYDTEAEVVRVDTEVVWVKIPGGVDETPVQKTVNAKVGDTVQVRVSGGRAFLVGNGTNPPTDDTRANEASYQAQNAEVHAINAEAAAADAQKSAESARIDASVAHQMAENATESAEEAKVQSQNATIYANNALMQLGTFEDVLGTLQWMETHGATYVATEDEMIVNSKHYFELRATEVSDPQGSPKELKLYELIDSKYVLSEDEEPSPLKMYYKVEADPVEEPMSNPKQAGYYQMLAVDEVVSDYINSHLSLTEEGLYILGREDEGRALFSTSGLDIYHAVRGLIAHFGESITLGDVFTYLQVSSTLLEFFLDKRSMAKFGYSEMFESYGVEVENVFVTGAGNALRLDNAVNGTYQGQYILETRANGHLSLKPGLRRIDEGV